MIENTAAPMQSHSMRPLNVAITDKKELSKSYMPFVRGGGLFIVLPEVTDYQVGNKVFVMLKLFVESKKPISAKIIWVMRTGPNRGIGINLGEGGPGKTIKDFIETSIADVPNKSEILSYTL